MKWVMPPLMSQLIATEEVMVATEGLLGAGQADGNTQNSPLMGSLREGGQHPMFEVYYFHIS